MDQPYCLWLSIASEMLTTAGCLHHSTELGKQTRMVDVNGSLGLGSAFKLLVRTRCVCDPYLLGPIGIRAK